MTGLSVTPTNSSGNAAEIGTAAEAKKPAGTSTAAEAKVPNSGRPAGARVGVLIALAALFLGFVALGTWQVERRSWKLDLIERVERRIHAPPVPAPGPAAWPGLKRANDEYRHVTASGRFVERAETRVQAVTERGAGYWLMTPLQTADGSLILVNRGFVASEERTAARASSASAADGAADPAVTVDGLLRLSEPGGGFLRRNDAAAGRWYSRDVAAIASARGLSGSVAPYFIDAGASSSSSSATATSTDPVGGLTVVAFSNNHLVYALTWYGLALLVLGAAWQVDAEARERRRQERGRRPT